MARSYTLRQLIKAYKWAKTGKGEMEISYGVYMTGPQWLAWFRGRLNEKINRLDNRRGFRKMDSEYQWKLYRDARTINDYYGKRIRNSGCRNILSTEQLRRRYPEVNSQARIEY